MPRAPGCAHGRTNEKQRPFFLEHGSGPCSFRGLIEVPRLAVEWVRAGEIKRKSRQQVLVRELAQVGGHARWREYLGHHLLVRLLAVATVVLAATSELVDEEARDLVAVHETHVHLGCGLHDLVLDSCIAWMRRPCSRAWCPSVPSRLSVSVTSFVVTLPSGSELSRHTLVPGRRLRHSHSLLSEPDSCIRRGVLGVGCSTTASPGESGQCDGGSPSLTGPLPVNVARHFHQCFGDPLLGSVHASLSSRRLGQLLHHSLTAPLGVLQATSPCTFFDDVLTLLTVLGEADGLEVSLRDLESTRPFRLLVLELL